jgi:sulfatase maturation enzyme AslB (radical SAM superfamily)
VQFDYFELLRNYTLQDSLNRFKGDYNNAQHVVIQLEARRFEDTRTIIKTDDGIMQLYLTNSCNLRCPHCYMVAGEKKKTN